MTSLPGLRIAVAAVGVAVATVTLVANQRGRAPRAPDQAQQQLRREGPLKAGDPAPDFSLDSRDGGPSVTLSSFRGRQPVALVFGSYT